MTEPAKNPPRATLIIAAWNASATIDAAVQSALAQTIPIEVIVVDDASTDDTAARVAAHTDAAPHHLTLLRQDTNQGPAAARNRAIDESRAPWISVLDADDLMAPDRLERLITQAETVGLDFLADDIEKVDQSDPDGPRTRLWSDTPIGTLPIDATLFVQSNIPDGRGERREMGFLKPVMRRAFLDEHALRYSETIRLGEDYDLYARALILGARFQLVDPRGYLALVRPNSLSGQHPTSAHADLMTADRHMLAMPQTLPATKAALRAHLLEQHKKWAWRSLIDAVRERRFGAALRCFIAPVPVVINLKARLAADIWQRLTQKMRSS